MSDPYRHTEREAGVDMAKPDPTEYWMWQGEDSTFIGTVQARFTKRSGKPMVALEDDRGLLHVYPDSHRLRRVLPSTGESK